MKQFFNAFLNRFELEPMSSMDVRMANPLMLAYVGDGVYELMVRTYMVTAVRGSMNDINRNVIRLVKATSQAYAVKTLEPQLTEEEMRIVKRGRNQKNLSVPKNTPVTTYKYATGFEALLGHLYLDHQYERLEEIVYQSIQLILDNPDTLKKKPADLVVQTNE